VLAASRRLGARLFGAARTVSAAGDDYDVAVGFAPRGSALAAWSQGTVSTSLNAAWSASP
jgi:hypothetical protein